MYMSTAAVETSEAAASLVESATRRLSRPPPSPSHGLANLSGGSPPDATTPLSTISEDSREALQSSSGEDQGLGRYRTESTVHNTNRATEEPTPRFGSLAEGVLAYKASLAWTPSRQGEDQLASKLLAFDDATATASEGSNGFTFSQREWTLDMTLPGASFTLRGLDSVTAPTVESGKQSSRLVINRYRSGVNPDGAPDTSNCRIEETCGSGLSSEAERQSSRLSRMGVGQEGGFMFGTECRDAAPRYLSGVTIVAGTTRPSVRMHRQELELKEWSDSGIIPQSASKRLATAPRNAHVLVGVSDREGTHYSAGSDLMTESEESLWKSQKQAGIVEDISPWMKNVKPDGGNRDMMQGSGNHASGAVIPKPSSPAKNQVQLSSCEELRLRRSKRTSAGSTGSSAGVNSSVEEETTCVKASLNDVPARWVQSPAVLQSALSSKPWSGYKPLRKFDYSALAGKWGPAQRVPVREETKSPPREELVSVTLAERESSPKASLKKALPTDEELLERLCLQEPASNSKSSVTAQEDSARKTEKPAPLGPRVEASVEQEARTPAPASENLAELRTPNEAASQSRHYELASSERVACQGGDMSREQAKILPRTGQLPRLGGKLPPLGGSGRLLMSSMSGSQGPSSGGQITPLSATRQSPATVQTPNSAPRSCEDTHQAPPAASPYPAVHRLRQDVPPASSKGSPMYATPTQKVEDSAGPSASVEKQQYQRASMVQASPSATPQGTVRAVIPNPTAYASPRGEGLPGVPSSTPEGDPASGQKIRTKFEDDNFVWVNNTRYSKISIVGKGGSSKVFKVLGPDRNIYALKRIRIHELNEGNRFAEEITLLRRLRGKHNIIQLIDSQVVMGGSVIHVVLECGEIDLHKRLLKMQEERKATGQGDKLDENFIRLSWQNMLKAVETIHEERIVHSDLKPANFLFVQGNLKLIDFGIAKTISNDTTSLHSATQAGTLNYMSPEAIMSGCPGYGTNVPVKVGRPSDIWSLGCILYQMVYRELPFARFPNHAKMQAICDGNQLINFPPISNPWLLDTMKKCLERDPQRRIAMAELLAHPFLHPDSIKPEAPRAMNGLNPTQLQDILAQLTAVAAAAPPGSVDVAKLTSEICSQLAAKGSVNLDELFAQFAANARPPAVAPPPPPPPRAPPPPPPRPPPPPPPKPAPKAFKIAGKGKAPGAKKADSASMGGELANMAAEKARQMAARRAAAAERNEKEGVEKENNNPVIDFRSKLKGFSRSTSAPCGDKDSAGVEDGLQRGQRALRPPLKRVNVDNNAAPDLHDILQRRLAKVRASQDDDNTTSWD